ncbi:MAG: AAA family ATPase [Bacteroidota bacterium]
MRNLIIGRKGELKILDEVFVSDRSEFISVTGRRRVGKTYLINAHFEDEIIFHFTGLLKATMKQQLINFHHELNAYFKTRDKNTEFSTWFEAFFALSTLIEKDKRKRKKVIFIDELPWLDTHKSNFITGLDWFWNSWAVKRKDILLVVCGSATSWMIRKIVNSRGGLHNRLTQRIHLKPFSLKETVEFLGSRKIKLSSHQISQLYMALGGIPHYLNDVRKGESAMQAIDRICFKRNGLLSNEFDNLYSALFKNSDLHLKVVRALSSKLRGLSRKEILSVTKIKDGGALSGVLEELSWCNFIESTSCFGKTKKDSLFRLTDEFSLFYLQFMHNKSNVNWMQLSASTKWKAWSGYAFENLCMKHLQEIKKALGISGVYTQCYAFQSRGNKFKNGTQIDLLIERNDRIINLCEIKFHDRVYSLTKDQARKIENKVSIFRSETKTRKTIFPTLITSNGVTLNENYVGLIDQDLTLEDLII